MDIFIALTVAQERQQDTLRHLENQQLVRQATMARQQKTEATQSVWKLWQQVIAAILSKGHLLHKRPQSETTV